MHCPLPHEKENSLRNNLQTSLCHKVSIRVTVVFFLKHQNRSRLFFITVINHNTNDIFQYCSMKHIKVLLLQYRSPSRHFFRPLYQLIYHTSTEHSTMTRPQKSQIRTPRPGVRHYNCLAIFFPRNYYVGSDHCM